VFNGFNVVIRHAQASITVKDNFKMNPSYHMQFTNTLDRGLAYAESCFETWRVVHGHVFLMVKHQQRLQLAMGLLGWQVDDAVVEDWFNQASEAAMHAADDVLVRMTISAGEAAWGLLPQDVQDLEVYVQLMPSQKRSALQLQAVVWRFPRYEKLAKFTADYAMMLRAMQTWKAELARGQQPLLCQQGDIMHSLTANVLLYRQGQWWTPDGLGILNGVVQGYLLAQGVLQACVCPTSWLDDCEAMACCNSGVFVQPVASINGRNLNIEHVAFAALYAALAPKKGVVL